jgi:XTP/dITP diphosphohydrolase
MVRGTVSHRSRLTVVLSTGNDHKIKEIRELLQGEKIEILSLSAFPGMPEVLEDGDTFLENAEKKARAAHAFTGLPALADDSGLEVDCLGGLPGVRSSRFAGPAADAAQNNQKLLSMLAGVEEERRTARFRCVVALADGKAMHYTEGVCDGLILNEFRGAGGFGYDPLFYYPPCGRTFAEMSQPEKNRVSHRGIAFRNASRIIRGWIEP